jgi:hypothetical protein
MVETHFRTRFFAHGCTAMQNKACNHWCIMVEVGHGKSNERQL